MDASEPSITEQVLLAIRDRATVWLQRPDFGPKWWWGPWRAWRRGWHQGESEAAGWIIDDINRELTKLKRAGREQDERL